MVPDKQTPDPPACYRHRLVEDATIILQMLLHMFMRTMFKASIYLQDDQRI
jgi:hypothetical protein